VENRENGKFIYKEKEMLRQVKVGLREKKGFHSSIQFTPSPTRFQTFFYGGLHKRKCGVKLPLGMMGSEDTLL